jgi:DNA repair protein RadC
MIMKEALQANSTVIALAHNHPSGSVRPSREDDMITKKVADACATMRIHLLDHLILTDGEYYSYREEGKI